MHTIVNNIVIAARTFLMKVCFIHEHMIGMRVVANATSKQKRNEVFGIILAFYAVIYV